MSTSMSVPNKVPGLHEVSTYGQNVNEHQVKVVTGSNDTRQTPMTKDPPFTI